MPLILVGIPLLAIMAGLVAYGFSQIQHGQSTGFLHWLEGVAENASFILGPVATQALKLTSWLTHYLGRYFEATFFRLVQFFSGLNQYVRLVASIALAWPQELFRVEQWLVWHEIPRLIKALPGAASDLAHGVVKVVKVVEGKVVDLPKTAAAAAAAALVKLIPFPLGQLWGVIGWLIHHFKGIVHAVEHAVGEVVHPGRLWKDVTVPFGRTIAQLKKWRRTLLWLGAFTGASALVSHALLKMGLNWIRCKNVGKTGKAICRAPTKWLENLLLGTVAIFGTISLRVFAKEVYGLTRDAADQINRFWRNDLKVTGANPGLGEIGGPKFLNTSTSYVAPNPGLGDVG